MGAQSNRFVAAHRRRYAVRIEDAPTRRAFRKSWRLNPQQPLKWTVIFVRETNVKGPAVVLEHTFDINQVWSHRIVRADVDLTKGQIRFHALRRKDPRNHLLLATHDYNTPTKRFKERPRNTESHMNVPAASDLRLLITGHRIVEVGRPRSQT